MNRSIAPLAAALTLALVTASGLQAQSPQPERVTLVGSLQQAIGCSENWSPPCDASQLAFDEEDGVWQARFDLPAGSYEYKVALNGSWDTNFGAGGAPGGGNIALDLTSPASLKFYFRSGTNFITEPVSSLIPVAVGSFQRAIGCASDWDPTCLRAWMEDPERDGLYRATAALPAGSFEAKVAMNESWTSTTAKAACRTAPTSDSRLVRPAPCRSSVSMDSTTSSALRPHLQRRNPTA